MPQLFSSSEDQLEPYVRDFYRRSIQTLAAAGVPFLVGGAYALVRYAGITRHTKDFDVFVLPGDVERGLAALAEAGFQTEMTFPHWLGKAHYGDYFVDLIFGAGNGVATVDDVWFDHAIDAELLGVPVRLIPVEEMIWSKGFVMERERYDGSDIAHLLLARAETLDWERLVQRFGANWRVLFSHLILFGFIYPSERKRIPAWVMQTYLTRLSRTLEAPAPSARICRGPLISRAQFLIDVEAWGYRDARLGPEGNMTPEEVAHWTAAIEEA